MESKAFWPRRFDIGTLSGHMAAKLRRPKGKMAQTPVEDADWANDTVESGNSIAPELPDRLRKAAEELGGVGVAAQRAGIPPRTFGHYLVGRDMRRAALVAYADATGVSLEWLATGRGPMRPGDAPADPEPSTKLTHPSTDTTSSAQLNRFVSIPRYNIEVSAGHGALVNHEQVVEYLAFDEDFIRQVIQRPRENLVLIEARGDSMVPTLYDGDLLLVDTGARNRIEHSCIYVLELNDVLLVKRIQQRLDGSMVVLSDNPRYQSETISAADFKQLRIIGQVIWQAGPVRS